MLLYKFFPEAESILIPEFYRKNSCRIVAAIGMKFEKKPFRVQTETC